MFSHSYDAVLQLDNFNEVHKVAWTWHGAPMRELAPVVKRIAKAQKAYGARLLAWKIVHMQLDMATGSVLMDIAAESVPSGAEAQ